MKKINTYFRNNIRDIPKQHISKLINKYIKQIKKAYIYNTTLEQWQKGCEEELKELSQQYTDEEKELNPLCQLEIEHIKKISTKEYYEKAKQKYINDLNALEIYKAANDLINKKHLFNIFKRHDLSFDYDNKTNKGSYLLQGLAWHNNYIITIYPGITHHNAKETITFLQQYIKEGNAIKNKKGKIITLEDAITIVNEFFKQFPNGTIHYG